MSCSVNSCTNNDPFLRNLCLNSPSRSTPSSPRVLVNLLITPQLPQTLLTSARGILHSLQLGTFSDSKHKPSSKVSNSLN